MLCSFYNAYSGEINMTGQPFSTLTSDHIALLRAVAVMDLAQSSSLSKHIGKPVSEDLIALRTHGYIREISSPRKDGTLSHLHTITSLGKEVLQSQGDLNAILSVPTIGPRPPIRRETYTGAEMQPFTGRAGSADALRYPSRVGNELRYRHDSNEPASESKKKSQNLK
jgi:hypothetical protein